jgi:AcrR family transcriptional regulator
LVITRKASTVPNPRASRRPTAKDAKREATRARLLDAARRLFAEYGYSGVSTTEIAREAGVTHGAIHAHFHSKAGLLFALISQSNETQTEAAEAIARTDGDCAVRLKAIIEVFLRHDLADLELLGVMQAYAWQWPYDHEAQNQAQLAAALKPVRTVLDDAVSRGELDPALDRDRAIRIIFAIYTQGVRAAIYEDATMEECLAEILAQIRMLLRGNRAADSTVQP